MPSNKVSLTDHEWFKLYTRRMVDLQSQQSEKPCNGGYAKQTVLDPLGTEFLFQCSCGVKHLFSYIEAPEGQRVLTVKQFYDKTKKEILFRGAEDLV